MKRIVQCVKPVENEYITVGEQYTFSVDRGQVSYRRTDDSSGSFMSYLAWKRALATGALVFIN